MLNNPIFRPDTEYEFDWPGIYDRIGKGAISDWKADGFCIWTGRIANIKKRPHVRPISNFEWLDTGY